MKKFLVGLAAVFVAIGAQAQGIVNFGNLGSAITDQATGELIGTDFTIIASVEGGNTVSAPILGGGTFLGGTQVVTDTFTGSVDLIFSVEGPGSDPWLIKDAAGNDLVVSVTPGDQGGSPPGVPAALGFPAGVSVVAVPEPSTIALGILGLGALALRRRRNA